jgi:nitrite reductase/ring-hydroxylating ferredoxin subunit
MEKSERVAIAKRILDLIARDEPEYGEESWETDVDRFTDPDRFRVEKQKLFLERPQLIALTADLPDPGDYYATDIAGLPILIVRGKDGVARAFLNACRHRGVKLAEGCGHGTGFTCPYHGWSYDNEGALVGVPSRQAFEASQLRGLIALPTVEAIGAIVVHPQPDGHLDFDDFLGPMKGVLQDFDMAAYELLSAYREPARVNWKHTADGGLEAYHAPVLHGKSVGKGALKQLLHLQFGMHHAMISPYPNIAALNDMPEAEWPHSCYFTSTNVIFPNTTIGGGGPMLFLLRGEPRDTPGLVDYILRIYGKRDASPADKAIQEAAVRITRQVALEEDLPAQLSTQAMMEAGAARSIVFGKREICLTRMHKAYDALIAL